MNWIPRNVCSHTEILRMWNRTINMEDNRKRFSVEIKHLEDLASAQTYAIVLISKDRTGLLFRRSC